MVPWKLHDFDFRSIASVVARCSSREAKLGHTTHRPLSDIMFRYTHGVVRSASNRMKSEVYRTHKELSE